LGTREAVSLIVTRLREDENGFVRKSAARTLGLLKATTAVAALREAINDDYAVVRKNAIRCLGLIGGSEAKKALEDAVTHKDLGVTELARQALDSFD